MRLSLEGRETTRGEYVDLDRAFGVFSLQLTRYLRRLTGGDEKLAETLVGDTFASLAEKAASGKRIWNLHSYLHQTAFHNLVNTIREAGRVAPIELLDDARAGSSEREVEEAIESKVLMDWVVQNLVHLTGDQRQVIELRFLEGYTLKQTAAAMGKKENCISVLQNRAIRELRRRLKAVAQDENV